MDVVLNWLWQGAIVGVAWFVMLLSLGRSRANVRYLVSWAALLLIVALPALQLLTPATQSPEVMTTSHASAMVALPDAWWTSTLVILAAWAAWAGVGGLRFVSAIVAIRRARAKSRVFPRDVEAALVHWRRVAPTGRHATLVLSDSVTAAAVLGFGPPLIAVAPALVATLEADELDRVLVHEWAHVQRRDEVVNVLQVVVRIVAGWHPALWWIDRRLHVEREIACDEMTVAITGSAKSYAACLMKLASLRGTARALQTAPAMFTPSDLRARIVSILSPRRSLSPVWSCGIAAAIVGTLCVMSMAVGGLTMVEEASAVLPFVSRPLAVDTADPMTPVVVPAEPSRTSEPPRREPVSLATTVQRPNAAAVRPAHSSAAAEPQAESRPPVQSNEGASPAPETARREEPAAPVAEFVPSAPPSAPAELAADTGVPPTPQAPRPVVSAAPVTSTPTVPNAATAESPTPWAAAAAGGAAIGRKSKDAGVATAGFFTRFAKGVAGSF